MLGSQSSTSICICICMCCTHHAEVQTARHPLHTCCILQTNDQTLACLHWLQPSCNLYYMLAASTTGQCKPLHCSLLPAVAAAPDCPYVQVVTALMARWPNAVLQFEDFSSDNASRLLARYRQHHLVFNDDIQVRCFCPVLPTKASRISSLDCHDSGITLVKPSSHGGVH